MKVISVKKAEDLNLVVDDIEAASGDLRECFATLGDEATVGEERREYTGQVEQLYEELCSAVRTLAKVLGTDKPDLGEEEVG